MEQPKKKFFTSEVKIGIVVVLAVFMLYFGINFLKGINIFTPNTRLYVQYTEVEGIVKTTHVLINGFQVGHVSDILFDYTKEAPITLEITVDKQLVVPKGTVAEIYDTGLMGSKAIRLHLGKESGLCQDGDTIAGAIAGGLIDQVMGKLGPAFDQLVPEVSAALQSVKNLAENPDLQASLGNVRQVTTDLKHVSAKLDKDIPPMLAHINKITDDVDKITGDIRAVDLKHTMNTLDSTLCNLNYATAQLKRTDNTLGLLLNDPVLYQRIDSTVASANSLLIDLKANPKRYVHFSVFGAKEKKEKSEAKK